MRNPANRPQKPLRWLVLIVLLALGLRLAFVFSLDIRRVNIGGDTNWLLFAGNALLTETLSDPPQIGPVYLLYSGLVQRLFGQMIRLPEDNLLITGLRDRTDTRLDRLFQKPDIVARFRAAYLADVTSWRIMGVLNAILGSLLCVWVFLIGRYWFGVRVGLVAALIIAVNPIFIIEAGSLLTETPFLSLLFAALALFGYSLKLQQAATHRPADSPSPLSERGLGGEVNSFFIIGVLLGLTTLTRAVALLLPLAFVIHLLIGQRRRALRLAIPLLLGYALMLIPWTVYNQLAWHRWVIGGEGIIGNFYIATRTDGWIAPDKIDQQIGINGSGNNQQKYTESALENIRRDLPAYLRLRVTSVAESILQPHNTAFYPGDSIKALIARWWSDGHSLAALSGITQADYFWPKAALYLFHFGALIMGVIGLLLSLRRFAGRAILFGIIGYFVALHLVLLAIPRYLFPVEPIWIVFAVFGVTQIADVVGRPRRELVRMESVS